MDLADYGLQVGDIVRWRRAARGNWTELKVKGIERDGSLSLLGPQGFRALRPETLQRKDRGPKGGVVWTPLQSGDAT
jgi:hypothetical protein